ncbi:MAG: hypothetical protein RL757_2409 [Bacteroidota bacterium]
MKKLNFEFKAKVENLEELEARFQALQPVFKGEDHQIDTYFNINPALGGRLKLREGNIENSLIYYERKNLAGAKQSDVLLYEHTPNPSLKAVLTKLHGVKIVVDKRRRIYFIENVKFHFDSVAQLGTFVEVEAIADETTHTIADLQAQCQYYFNFFELENAQYMQLSYSDLLANQP